LPYSYCSPLLYISYCR